MEKEVPIEQVRIGDVFVVRPGENIPVDGIVREGSSAVNEAALTGESIPVDKAPGDTVSAATLNQSGLSGLRGHPGRRGHDTFPDHPDGQRCGGNQSAHRQGGRPGIRRLRAGGYHHCSHHHRRSGCWQDKSIGFALARGISVLVISCPCALGLATPVAIMVGNGMGAKHGTMFKTAVSLEETGKIQIVALG